MHDCNFSYLESLRKDNPEKFVPVSEAFSRIHRGDRIFISTGCGEPQHLVRELMDFVKKHPRALHDTEILHMWTMGGAPYTNPEHRLNFRHNTFFPSSCTRLAVNECEADYTPIFLSQVPDLILRKVVPVDVGLLQVSLPDARGYVSLGVSVDIARAVVERARILVAQVNAFMPRVHGNTFIPADRVDFFVHQDEPLLEYRSRVSNEIAERIGKYVARIVEDGDTIQAGVGSLPNAVMANLAGKRHLGVHTDLLTDGVLALMKSGVVDNSRKTLHRGKTVASFCMGSAGTYEFLHDNPSVEFHGIDYTNNPLVIAQHENMTTINSAFEIDLTGQATASSLGRTFYHGVGGQADFLRGAAMAKNGKTIIALPSTAEDGSVSRIVPFLQQGAGVTLIRGDINYVVTEYGISYLHGKSIRQRAMELIGIAHPRFRSWLVEQARSFNLIYKDQGYLPGKSEMYPEELETYRTTRTGIELFLRSVKVSDEPLLKDFFTSLTDRSLYNRFASRRTDVPREQLQEFSVIDYSSKTVILALRKEKEREIELLGIGQYGVNRDAHTAEAAFVVRDAYQNSGIGTTLLEYCTMLAKKQGLLGFTAEVFENNYPMLRVFKKMGFDLLISEEGGDCSLRMTFRE